MEKEEKQSNKYLTLKVFSWKEIVSEIKSPYNTYVFVSMRNSGKSKSIRNLVVELLEEIPHHNLFSLAQQLPGS